MDESTNKNGHLREVITVWLKVMVEKVKWNRAPLSAMVLYAIGPTLLMMRVDDSEYINFSFKVAVLIRMMLVISIIEFWFALTKNSCLSRVTFVIFSFPSMNSIFPVFSESRAVLFFRIHFSMILYSCAELNTSISATYLAA